MVLTASLCDAPHIEFELGRLRECICRRVEPDYAADLSVPILDRGRNAKRRGDRLFDHVHVQCTCIDLIIFIIN